MAGFNKIQQFSYDLCQKVHNLNSDTLNCGLSNSAPNAATNKVWADISEISAGNGYSAGGSSAGVTNSQSGGTFTLTGANITWTASGGSIGPFEYVVIYNTSTSPNTKPLIGWWDYGGALTLTTGETFTIKFNGGASSGTILTLV